MLLYYISDRTQFPGDEPARRRALLRKVGEAARNGVDFIQLREKDLSAGQWEELTREAMRVIVENAGLKAGAAKPTTRLLVNSRTDVAIAAGSDGVHLRADDISPLEVRKIWKDAGLAAGPTVGVSCHSVADVTRAGSEGADFTVFAPVFEKRDLPGSHPAGLELLREACRQKIPVLALGGVTIENARSCLEAGAAGVAGIRLFQENGVSEVVGKLRDPA